MATYLRPTTLEEALAALAADAANPPADPVDRLTPLAGATDFYPAATTRQAWFQKTPRNILDLSAVRALHGYSADGDRIRLGALTTWTDIITWELPAAFYALKQASHQIGGVQIQNRGTIAGNICNASPAADGVPPLLALDAEVEIASLAPIPPPGGEGQIASAIKGRGHVIAASQDLPPSRRGFAAFPSPPGGGMGASLIRCLPLATFILGNRKTALQPGELVTAIHVPKPADGERSIFLKLGSRAYLVISIASVAANIALDAQGRIARARVAVGACSAVPQRLTALEQRLQGLTSEAASRAVEPAMLAALSPIDDIRASAEYRRHAALLLVRRALDQLAMPERQAA
jgi:CO/xanthine dehydrogenase FAD-binding subunit